VETVKVLSSPELPLARGLGLFHRFGSPLKSLCIINIDS